MESRCFMFDLVILNLSINDFEPENNTLTIEVNFNNNTFTIESNPDKIGEFKQGRTCEFRAYPDDLSIDLLDCPLKLKILADENEIKGEVDFNWPEEMLEMLENPNFNHYNHFDECDLLLNRVVVGKIAFQYRLRCKCELSESEKDCEEEEEVECGKVKKRSDIKNELKRIVDPNELFFLIQSDSDICDALYDCPDKYEEKCPTALDLSKFRNFHGKVVKDAAEVDKVYTLDCCHNKKYSFGKCKPPCACINILPKLQKPFGKCCGSRSKSSIDWACKASQHLKECPHSDKFSDETTECCSCISSQLSCDADSENDICKCPQSPPVLKESVYIRPRYCPICKNDVSWLPRLAACTKCGHKPTPYTVDRPYNENLTADQILAEWAIDTPNQNNNTEKPFPRRINRCTCKNGKICAYCRIRKICKDVLKTKKCCAPNDKCSTDSGEILEQKSGSKICKSTSSAIDCRTHLAQVFSEIQDLYNLKPVGFKRELDWDKKCEKSFEDKKVSKRKRPPTIGTQKKNETTSKNPLVEAKRKLCRKKLYNYKTVRKYPGNVIGHGTCLSSGKMVPGNMGWLWNADTEGLRSGWKPGAIRKPIKEIMKYFLKDFPVDSLNVSRYCKNKTLKKKSEDLIQKPTLHICKKKDAYIITMRPIKDAKILANCADPYVPMKPIQFRIVKNPRKACAREIKRLLKEKFDKCCCRKPISHCFCRTFLEKKRLEFELSKVCQLKGIPNLKDSLVLSDTSDSEAEFDFGVTPPAGVIKPQLKKKPDLACRETQYSADDWIIKPAFPRPLNKFMKPFDPTGGRLIPTGPRCPNVCGNTSSRRGENTRKLPVSGTVGGWGGVGGNNGSGRKTGGGPTNTKPLFCNLARRGMAETACCSYPVSTMPIC
ncbi:uncharacterized protein LOC129943353 [Eupeodes corollae]|uniref:uncharacterized protein LOC129943353 n=1 Tax=Eupeodes corollae TaxID=290404 RepID=UPI002491FAF5|nr:uncharacterized protein LOC129943353 [Eupeodes corollae]